MGISVGGSYDGAVRDCHVAALLAMTAFLRLPTGCAAVNALVLDNAAGVGYNNGKGIKQSGLNPVKFVLPN